MLDTFIIQKIRDEEAERRSDRRRPFLEVPVPARERPEMTDDQDQSSEDRGVVIIEPDED